MPRIIANVHFEHGYHGYEETHPEPLNVASLIKHFEDSTNKANDTNTSVVAYIDKVEEDVEGNYFLDDNGNRILTRIYTNENLQIS